MLEKTLILYLIRIHHYNQYIGPANARLKLPCSCSLLCLTCVRHYSQYTGPAHARLVIPCSCSSRRVRMRRRPSYRPHTGFGIAQHFAAFRPPFLVPAESSKPMPSRLDVRPPICALGLRSAQLGNSTSPSPGPGPASGASLMSEPLPANPEATPWRL